MATGLASVASTRRQAWARPAVRVWAAAVVLAVGVLWWLQLSSLTTPCAVPDCVWPRLSDAGLRALSDLGLPAWTWTAAASIAALVWAAVPFAVGVVLARSDTAPPLLAALWFTLSLGTFSAVPADPATAAVLRVLVLGAWFTAFALYPTGRFSPPWIAAAPILATAWTIVLTTPPVRAAEAANDPLWWTLEAAVYVACVVTIVAGQLVQFVRGDRHERRRVGLLLVGFAPFAALGVISIAVNLSLDPDAVGYGTIGGALLYEASSLLTVVLIALVGVGMLRHGAFGVKAILDRVLVGTVALTLAGVVYTAVVLGASLLAPAGIAQAIAAVVTAVVLAGLYSRLARGIGRLIHGDADDPSVIAAALAQRVADAGSTAELGPAIAAELALRLRLPGVAIRTVGDSPVRGEAGRGGGRRVVVPLMLDERVVGEADVALRAGQARLSPRDRTALAAASGPLATAVTAMRLSEEVRRSRFEIVAGRDEERRMLRRRLHDEIGPTLALAGHRIAAARDDPDQLEAASRTVDDAVAQLRAVSRELRPPALDEWGLRAALVAFADGLVLPAAVDAPERVTPGAVEVAVYRIAVEALLNVVRHADATRASIAVRAASGRIVVDVDDDGRGLPVDVVPGVGTLSMRERAVELGGTLELVSSPLGGVRVHAELPLIAGGAE